MAFHVEFLSFELFPQFSQHAFLVGQSLLFLLFL